MKTILKNINLTPLKKQKYRLKKLLYILRQSRRSKHFRRSKTIDLGINFNKKGDFSDHIFMKTLKVKKLLVTS